MNREAVDHEPRGLPRRLAPAALALVLTMGLGVPQLAEAASALRVVRDAATGELRAPNAAEVAAFEKAEEQLRIKNGKPATPTPPVEVRYPDGTVETKLGDDTLLYSVVKENGDGSLAMACLPGKQAQAFVKGSSKKPVALKSKSHVGHKHD